MAAFSLLAGPAVTSYWPVAALSVFDTRTDTTLARLMITPLWWASRSYLRLGQDQAAPVVQRLSDGLKRLALPAEVLRYHARRLHRPPGEIA